MILCATSDDDEVFAFLGEMLIKSAVLREGLHLAFRRQILIPEEDDPTLSDQQCQLIKLSRTELGELYIFEECANGSY